MRGSPLAEAWLVLLLAVVFGGALAAVHVGVSDRIAQNKLNETLGQIPALVPGAESGERSVVGERVVYRALADGKQLGWVIPATGQGFADRVELLIGVDAAVETITGIYVLDQKETPGLGNKIVNHQWRAQFAGKSAREELTLSTAGPTSGQRISAITGATISSETVCHIVNETLAALRGQLLTSEIEE